MLMQMPSLAAAEQGDCFWSDTLRSSDPAIIVESGVCYFSDIASSQYIDVQDASALVSADIIARPGSTLILRGQDIMELRLSSSSAGYVNLIAEGSYLVLDHVAITSFDPVTGGPDLNISDGRSFIRVDSFLDQDGSALNGRLEMDHSKALYLGFESRGGSSDYSGYGLSLKVRREDELLDAQVTGWIRNSQLSHNYRGFYSYGARNFDFFQNIVTFNSDYGVDPHDDSSGFVARDNVIAFNEGTGLALSRRCGNSMVSGNTIIGNGANGILIHDLSNNTHVINNSVSGNFLDGIVVHDSHGVTVDSNIIRGNRNGVRLFAGSVRTSIMRNSFYAQQQAALWILNGSLDQAEDLSDYSSGPRWNSQNISRHNDGRVWSTLIVENDFFGDAEIVVDEARYFISSHNRYWGNVLFDIDNSNDVSLDGRDAEGSVQYRMRRGGPSPITYSIDPSEGAILSVTSGDRVELLGEASYFPSDNPNFTLELANGERPVIAAAGRVGSLDVQTGQLIYVPISAASGRFTLSSYSENLNLGDPVRMELTSADWLSASIMVQDQNCALFEWELERVSVVSMYEYVFFHQASDPLSVGQMPVPAAGRLMADLRCVPGTISEPDMGSF